MIKRITYLLFIALLTISCTMNKRDKTAEDTLEVMREIEAASGIPFTGIVNNSNLGVETTPEDVVKSIIYAQELSRISKLPVVFTTVNNSIAEQIGDKIPDLFPLELQKNKF